MVIWTSSVYTGSFFSHPVRRKVSGIVKIRYLNMFMAFPKGKLTE
jgi:hypothetical protein